jgi:4-amino-4-deoxychorismate lyase
MDALFNGEAAAGALVQARGLHYGDGVFRTVLCWQGELLDWPRHVAKLAEDAGHLGLEPPDGAVLLQDAHRLCAAQPDAVIKILWMRQARARGDRPGTAAADRLLCRYPVPPHRPEHWTQGIRVARSTLQLAAQPLLAGVKHMNRLEQILASRDWPEGAEELLLGDASGQLICGTRSNLFLVRAGRLATPALRRCGVAGIMRQKILEAAAELGIATEVVDLGWSELETADEAFVCNALIGLWPLRCMGTREWPAPGRLTLALARRLAHPWQGHPCA